MDAHCAMAWLLAAAPTTTPANNTAPISTRFINSRVDERKINACWQKGWSQQSGSEPAQGLFTDADAKYAVPLQALAAVSPEMTTAPRCGFT
jgi:hypothetical protein